MRPVITLTTDFGVSSPYVAQMKGEILSRNREAVIVDITHGIRPQQIVEGAIVLDDATWRFPPGTIHVAVVDPGVGTERPLLYAEIGPQRYLAPDNGLLTLVAQRQKPARFIELRERAYWAEKVSHTFHGRDILAPVAAHLSLGLSPEKLGRVVDHIVTLSLPQPRVEADYLVGHVLLADSLGNVITNIRREQVERLGPLDQIEVSCRERSIPGISRTYGERASGELVALFDSQDRLELAVVNGSAAAILTHDLGTEIVVRRKENDQ